MIMKENAGRFKLVCLLSLLEGDLHKKLRILGEGKLLENVLQDCAVLEEYPEIKEVI